MTDREKTDLTVTPQQLHSNDFRKYVPEQRATDIQLAKMLALLAPASMGPDARLAWIASAAEVMDGDGITAEEIANVSLEVRSTVSHHNRIVPEICRLVSEKRARGRRISDAEWSSSEVLTKTPVMDRRGEPMTEAETAQLNEQLAAVDATARYRPDGSRYRIDKSGRFVGEMDRPFRRIRAWENEMGVPPLTRDELDKIPAPTAKLGIKLGYLKVIDGTLVETEAR